MDMTQEEHRMTWTPDPSFYPSPRMASKAAPETVAYVAAFDPDRKTPDAIAVVDVDQAEAPGMIGHHARAVVVAFARDGLQQLGLHEAEAWRGDRRGISARRDP